LTLSNTVSNGSRNTLSLSLTLSSGLFSGSATVPGTRQSVWFKGALLQNRDVGCGYFLGTNQSGSVYFGEDLGFVLASVQPANSASYSLQAVNAHGFGVGSATLSVAPLWLGAARLTTGQLEFTLHSLAGKVCVIEASTNLVNWTPALTVTNFTGTVSLTNAMTGFPYRFFRAKHPQ
jgi:hypothetical protein